MRKLAFLILALASLAHADKVDDLANAELKASHAPGLALAVVKDGKIVKVAGYGVSNVELNTPVKPETPFRVASMSKQFCAGAAMLLVQEGKWALDDPISKYVPNAPAEWAKIKLRHLLTHTSGMPQLEGLNFRQNPGPDEYIALLKKQPLRSAPGDKYEYSNEGYSLLGILVGKVSGKPLDIFVQERLFEPVGMTASCYYKLENIVPERANGYIWDKDHLENAIPLRPYAMAGSGGITSSVLDFAKWDAVLYTDKPLAKALRDQMWTSAVLNDGKKTGYGFGWGITRRNGKLIVSHNGGTAGFNSRIVRHVDDRLTVIVFENVQGGNADDLANKIADLYLTGTP